VNLNSADATALETLPRIGPAMAQRILAWRDENGRFTAVEDLLDVPGIGDATFAGLRELVTV
jgi:competence protein ComEA